jgi:NAD-dependent histone deacetylase SIR2
MIMGAPNTPPSTAHSDDDGAISSSQQPPRKRRRITKDVKKEDEDEDEEGKPQYLDLSSMKVDQDEQEQLAKLLKVLHKRRKIGMLHL